jgi:hypothetical protein
MSKFFRSVKAAYRRIVGPSVPWAGRAIKDAFGTFAKGTTVSGELMIPDLNGEPWYVVLTPYVQEICKIPCKTTEGQIVMRDAVRFLDANEACVFCVIVHEHKV